MRKLKQILASFLAVNLAISATPSAVINAKADETYNVEIIEETATPEQTVPESDTAYYDVDTVSAVTETEAVVESGMPVSENATGMENTSNSENSTSVENTTVAVIPEKTVPSSTDTPSTSEGTSESIAETISEITEGSTSDQNADTSMAESSTESSEEETTSSEEESSSEESSEEESESETEEENQYAFSAYEATGVIELEQLKGYEKDENGKVTVTVNNGKELILLSNCDPKSLQDITIALNITGGSNLTSSKNIKKDEDISEYLKTSSVTVEDYEEATEQSEAIETSENSMQTSQDVIGKDQNQVTELATSVLASQDYSFKGIGTAEYPFKGTITGTSVPLKMDRAFFGVISSEATIKIGNKLSLHWSGNGSSPMVADVYQFSSNADNGHQLQVTVSGDPDNTSATMGSLIGTVEAAEGYTNQKLIINKENVTYNKTVAIESTDNAGLVCNTLKSGTICIEDFALPTSNYTITSTGTYNLSDKLSAGNAGGLIGAMGENTTLQINSSLSSTTESGTSTKETAIIVKANGNAGGLVGLMASGSKIVTEENGTVNLKSMTITGSASAGGVVGDAENVNFSNEDLKAVITIDSPSVNGNAVGANVGGFAGKYTIGSGPETVAWSYPTQITITTPDVNISGNTNENGGNAGGYFGLLELKNKASYTIGTEDLAQQEKSDFEVSYSKRGAAYTYGGLIGQATATDKESTLKIQNLSVTSKYVSYANSGNGEQRPQWHGGLIGYVGGKTDTTYLEVKDVTITAYDPHSTKNGYFGGVASYLASKSIIKAVNIKVVTNTESGDKKIWEGGGILGQAAAGSVLELSGYTDLTDTHYDTGNTKTAQLVGANDSALIYAKGDGNGNGWTYKRSTFNGSKGNSGVYNDLLWYGQVIRLKSSENATNSALSNDLITINGDHDVVLKSNVGNWNTSGETFTFDLNNADDFALLSIAWNSRGYFGVGDINTSNWSKICNSIITLTGDIDLTGTGITGLSRDTLTDKKEGDDTFSGTLNGNSKKLTLAIGETFGTRSDVAINTNADGSGIVYAVKSYHTLQGIFARTSNATIQNIVIDGSISVSNGFNEGTMAAGGIAAVTVGSVTIDNVTAQERIYVDGAKQQEVSVGGLFGKESGGELELKENTKIAPKITLENINSSNNNGTWAYAGGIMGRITTANYKVKISSAILGNEESEENNRSFIMTDATGYAYIGGLVGLIDGIDDHWIEIHNLAINGFNISAEEAAQATGGLFGSVWQNVGVYFMRTNTETNTNEPSMLTVKNAKVTAGSAGAGGLAYRSSGIWEIRDKGIDIQSLSIESKGDVGLLVCRGEKGKIKKQNNATETDIGGLYVKMTAYWETAYKLATDTNNISITQTTGVFDEFVAHTAETANVITDNDKNGIISIATQAEANSRVGVAEEENNCTTYQNRTQHGKETNYKTNGCSRYYYDLDQWLKEVAEDSRNGNGNIDTPQELMLWSVYLYAESGIKNYIVKQNEDGKSDLKYNAKDCYTPGKLNNGDRWLIQPATSGGSIELDMKKYSYYPVRVGSLSINFNNAILTFYNEQIENAEQTNKSTAGTRPNHTQHFTMHCGLLFNYTSTNGTLTVDTVIFSGSIGKIHNNDNNASDFGSGALIANSVVGSVNRVTNVTVKNSVLQGLKVNKCGTDYAPLLINKFESYTRLTVNGLSAKEYTEGTAVASSLIGKVGDTNAKQINLSFEDIVLPDKPVNKDESTGIFSHATLLESFTHDGTSSGATYNFLMEKEWKDNAYTHGVTYGWEITESVEYKDMQKWYYDELGYKTDPNLVHTEAQTDFSSANYLPYVHVRYTEGNRNHEIKVNQRMANIVNGCGTYGHPYIITTGREMTTLADYIGGGTAPLGWCVTITGNQGVNHSVTENYESDVTYKYQGTSGWVKVQKNDQSSETWPVVNNAKPLPNEVMRAYLQNAYYDLQGVANSGQNTLEITNFGGFGNSTYPFRGVITSTTNTTVELEGSAPTNGFVGYSYGCVIKDLTISYIGCVTNTISYSSKTFDYYSDKVFGGVIGCVLGGDNIIDNVSVQYATNSLSLTEDKKHLIPVGGYVGEIAGGGVIFRNIKTSDTGLQDSNVSGATEIGNDTAYQNLYVNPYVGRVLDGFAIYELTKTGTDSKDFSTSLNNTNKNYQITTLDKNNDAKRVTITSSNTDSIVNIVDAKGMFVLSAVVNSGAASNGNSNAYNSTASNTASQKVNNVQYNFAGKYGKVRNASYNFIGKTVDDAASDFALSIADDQKKPGVENNTNNLPYLVTQYCSNAISVFSLCGDSGAKIQLQANSSYDMSTFGAGYQGIGARYASNAILSESKDASRSSVNSKNVVPEIADFNGNGNTITVNTVAKEYTNDDFCTATVGGVFNELRVGTSGSTVQKLTIQGAVDSNNKPTAEVSLQYYDARGTSTSKPGTIVDVGGFAGTISRISLSSRTSASATFDGVSVKNLKITGPRNAGGLLGSSITKGATETIAMEERLLYAYNVNSQNDSVATVISSNDVGIQLINVKHENLVVTALMGAGGFVGYLKTSDSSLVVTQNNWVVGSNSTITSTYDEDCKKAYQGSSATGQETETGAGGVFGYVNCNVTINSSTAEETYYKEAKMQNVTVTAKRYAGGFIGKIAGNTYTIKLVSFNTVNRTGASISTIVEKQDTTTNLGSSDSRKEGAGGIIGYAKGSYNSNNIIENCTLNGTQINEATTATQELNQDHEGAGGIVGLITDGSRVSITNCTVTNSNIYGAVAGGIAGITKVTTTFENCTVTGASESKKSNIKARCTASGILGYWFSTTNNTTGTLENCHVRYADISGQHWGVGALIGDSEKNTGSLSLFDSSVRDSDVTAQDGSWYQGGGIIGDLRCDLTASNLLFSNVKITVGAENKQGGGKKGLLIAKMDAKDKKIYIAGVSIQNIPKDNLNYPLVGGDESYTGYIAFADYSGQSVIAMNTEDSSGSSGSKSLLDAKDQKPYVVTSPKSALSVDGTEDVPKAFLYGDGAYWTKSTGSTTPYETMAQTIWKDAKAQSSQEGSTASIQHYKYSNIGNFDFDFASSISDYNTNQTTQITENFPVLLLSGGDGDKVTNYLDILTNGGFSAANGLSDASSHVAATAEVYRYQEGKFVKSLDKPALDVKTSATSTISFSVTTDYDNTKERFTLLIVTFKENDHTYNVLVPIIVRRMLEMDFTATLTYGTDFNKENYKLLTDHILESYGSSITGYLTYTYNSDAGKFTEYGWQSYINAGGNVMDMEKSIRFATTTAEFPKGTQLTLVDADSGKAYYYTATGNEERVDNAGFDIPLSVFIDSTGKAYVEPSISELIGVTVADKGENLIFVKVDKDGKPENPDATKSYPKPTVRIKNASGEYEYYRLADASLGEVGVYSITVKEEDLRSKENTNKSSVTENYYLVITVPKSKDGTTTAALNGSIQTKITSAIPNRVHYRTIGNGDDTDHDGTASTYQLSDGYRQSLKETGNDSQVKKISMDASKITVDVTDTITFPSDQAYNVDKDELYLRFVNGWQQTLERGTTNERTSAQQFPSGTTGTANFYVYKDNGTTKTYYTYENGKWTPVGENEQIALSYDWKSDGGNMELPLATEQNGTPISLREIRTAVKGNNGSSTFCVRVCLTASIPPAGLDVVPETKLVDNRPNDYVKLTFLSQLSTVPQSLTYSSNRASASGTTEYYRDEPLGAKLTYDADLIDQLGINLLDLQYLDAASQNSLIETTALYDMSSIKNIESTLKGSKGIKFTLTLSPKNTTATSSMEEYGSALTNASDYISVAPKLENSGTLEYTYGTWSWIVPQSTYYDSTNNQLIVGSIFDGTTLKQAIELKVNIANVENKKHLYSNYRVVLTAEILGTNDQRIEGTYDDDNIIYTLAKISMNFVDGPASEN